MLVIIFLYSGYENDVMSIWRYELLTNSWHKGPSMRTPRCLLVICKFCGDVACVAGGVANKMTLNSG